VSLKKSELMLQRIDLAFLIRQGGQEIKKHLLKQGRIFWKVFEVDLHLVKFDEGSRKKIHENKER
jgi:hypothetical protein